MGKFSIECPKFGSINTASTFIFAKKVIKCGNCQNDINVRESRLTSKICPVCKKTFVFDQAKGAGKRCPSCGEKINAAGAESADYIFTHVECPQCSCSVEVDKTQKTYACPICNFEIDVEREMARGELVKNFRLSVIEYRGDDSTFVWKHPLEDFNSGSTLIVREGQEAIFVSNGKALPAFGPGKYTLDTDGDPIFGSLAKKLTDGHAAFSAEVYFINKTIQMGIKWGTNSHVSFVDPETGISLEIGACGEMNLQVEDGKTLLTTLVGTTGGLDNRKALSEGESAHRTVRDYFRAPVSTEVKTYLAGVIREKNISILEIDAHLGELSEELKTRISPRFEEFGLKMTHFYVTRILLPEDDKNLRDIKALRAQEYFGVKSEEVKAGIAKAQGERKKIEAENEGEVQRINAQTLADVKMTETSAEVAAMRAKGLAEAEIMRAKGYTEKDLINADVQKAYASGLGAMSSSGAGVMTEMMSAMAGMKLAGNMIDKMETTVAASDSWECSCGEKGNTKKFCQNCGKPRPAPTPADTWDCACGEKGIKGKFCPECGSPRPAHRTAWDCACGEKGITGKFCPECGAPRPAAAWDCPCGKTGIESKFCPECGRKRDA